MLGILTCAALCFVFALFAGQGSLIGAAALIGFVATLLLLISGPMVISIVILAGVPTVFVFPNTILQAVPFINTERFIYLCAVGPMLLAYLLGRSSGPAPTAAEKFAFAFLVVALASYAVAVLSGSYPPDFIQDVYFLLMYVMGFSGFIIARNIDWNEKTITRLIDILLLVGLFMTGQAIAQNFLNIDIFVPKYLDVPHANEDRVTGTFANSSEYGAVAATFVLLGLFRYNITKDAMARFAILAVTGAITVAVILAKTRAPWLAMGIAILLIARQEARIRPIIFFSAAAGALLGLILIPIFVDLTDIQSRLLDLGPIYNRFAVWATGVSMGLQNPLLGVGFGSAAFKLAQHDYAIDIAGIDAFWQAGLSIPHNEFVHVFSMTGVLGITLFIACIYSVFRLLHAVQRNGRASSVSRSFAGFSSIILINWVINGFFVDLGSFWYLMFVVFFLSGMALSLARTETIDRPLLNE